MNQLTAQKKNMGALLEQMKPRMAQVLPKHVTPERMVRTALLAVNRNPELLDCTQETFLGSMMTAASLGLEVSGTLGSAYLVPYKNRKKGIVECQLIIGYRGLIDLARRSGQIKRIEAHAVYEGEHFVCEYGLSPKLEHRPELDATPGAFRCVYAIAELADGSTQSEVMTRAQVDRIKGNVKFGPWVDHYAEMARKTVVRRLAKYLPLSPELAQALTLDNEADAGTPQTIDVDILPDEARSDTKADRMAERLGAGEDNEDAPLGVDPETGEVIEDEPAEAK